MEEALIKRVLPHSVEAEQSVIGSMIMDRDAIMTASEVITSEDFYQSQYGVLFDAMLELYNEGKPVDLVTLQERLREKDVPPEISSLEFVKDLLDAVPTSANVRHYATIVQEKSMLRKLIKVNEEIANTCYLAKERTEDILEETEKKIFDLLQYRSTGDFVPIKQVVLNALDKIEKASKNKGTVTGIPTGFIDLDYKTSGFQPSDLILIAARPSMGKTAFVLNVAQNMAFKEGKTVAIFSLEMEHNLGIIIIDYLQLMSGGKRSESRQQEISEISRSLKAVARELNVPVVALSQLSRAVEQRPDHRPMLSDLRESGAIEQDADVVMFLYRDDYYNKDTDKKNIAEVIIAKQRNGPIGTVELVWLPNYTKFANMKK